MNSWAFFDDEGNEITRGWQGHEDQARAHAQAFADDRGVSVEFQRESELSGLDEGEQPRAGEVVKPERDSAEDHGEPSKDIVESWDAVASYVVTFPSDGDDGACDVSVEIGEAEGAWFLRTSDDAGGSDDAPDTSYSSEDAAREAAEALASARNEAADGDDAEAYLARKRDEAAGEPSDDGEHCVYWSTVGDGSGPRERYDTLKQAEAAVERANTGLRASNPGSHLLCGFEARSLIEGEWVAAAEKAGRV